MLLANFLSKTFKEGGIILIDHKGQKYICGDPSKEKPLTLKLIKKDLNWKLLLNPGLYLGEEYAKHNLEIENGTMYDFLCLCLKNIGRGEINKYSWVDIGSSYLPSDILAAILYAQLEQRELIQAKRKKIWENYYEHLDAWANKNDICLPTIPENCEHPYHMFYLLMPTLEKRNLFIQHLKKNGIMAVFHYLPLHLSEMGKKFGGKIGDCPVTENISDCLVRLPFYNDLNIQDLNFNCFYDF